MMHSVQITDFRGHSDTRIPLEPFTLLVGDNGVGKSTVLEAVELVHEAFTVESGKLFVDNRSIEWLSRSGSEGFEVVVQGRDLGLEWRAEVKSKGSPLVLGGWRVGEAGAGVTTLTDIKRPPVELLDYIRAVVLHLDPDKVAATSEEKREKRLGPDGTGFATTVAEWRVNDPSRAQAFEGAVQAVLPSLSALAFPSTELKLVTTEFLTTSEGQVVSVPKTVAFPAREMRIQFEGTEPLPARCASDGTLLILGLFGHLHSPDRPSILLLDDIDRGLHPRAQALVVSKIREVMAADSGFQVVATTHSPYLADSFDPKEVVVLGRPKADGPVVARRLSDHPDQKLLKSLATGEFLTASGREWFGL